MVKKGEESNEDLRIEIDQQLDNIIYKLYELTYEEVLIVEPEFSERMSKDEYESLEVE